MRLFVKCQRFGEDSYVIYEGYDQATVLQLLTDIGATDITFITEDEFKAANPPRH